MPSLVPGFEYDIFISYRQNDNRSGWVTEFIHSLQDELVATLKDPVSVYFDANPATGIRETDDVDKSLEGKLKCLIFIPIVSQTYCDPKSFAWQSEFCVFNRMAKEDQFGRDIRLGNGNVASRILPIKIHDLDIEDKALLENELGTVLRAVEFIFKTPGVNRPLRAFEDHPQDNLNKTFYRDQLNKVANAIKEIITSIKHTGSPTQLSAPMQKPKLSTNRKKSIVLIAVSLLILFAGYLLYSQLSLPALQNTKGNKSIAVLSFIDLSPNGDQEYLGDGMAEEILNALTKIKGLKVIGRTSSFSFKGKHVDLKTIGATLGANTILEGSIQKSGNKIRVTAQLINAKDEVHIWSERYDSELADIFAVQDDIAQKIVKKMKGTLLVGDDESPTKARSDNIDAYEMLLKARLFRVKGLDWQSTAIDYYKKATALDSTYAQAYAELSAVYWNAGYLGIADQNESFAKAEEAAAKAIAIDESCYDGYNMLSFLNLTKDWDWQSSLKNYEIAVSLGLPLPDKWHAYYECWLYGSNDRIIKEAESLVANDPLSVDALVHLSRIYFYAKRYDDVFAIAKRTLEISPNQSSILRQAGEAYLFSSKPDQALSYFEKLMTVDARYVPHDLIAAHIKLGNREIARAKFNEAKDTMGPVKRAICYFYLGETEKVFTSLEEGYREKDAGMVGIKIDPHFDGVRSDPRFMKILTLMKFPE